MENVYNLNSFCDNKVCELLNNKLKNTKTSYMTLGKQGSGKTTLNRILVDSLETDRIVTIEEDVKNGCFNIITYFNKVFCIKTKKEILDVVLQLSPTYIYIDELYADYMYDLYIELSMSGYYMISSCQANSTDNLIDIFHKKDIIYKYNLSDEDIYRLFGLVIKLEGKKIKEIFKSELNSFSLVYK